ncbi:MAG: tRNA lysidine(34) synthetase TilS, partial [Campylobacteraceae bacterium]|nr:tRNA lysidine(34) synthetase TilS [Campylobacteraceae bacterium]
TEHHYTTLLTAHHLNDRLEWFLMQLGRGSGLVEMLGMREFESKQNYTLVRPLLHVSKASLLFFLENNEFKYFIDESNDMPTYLRNKIRKHHATPLIETYEEGICKSFAYLEEDAKRLLPTNTKRIQDLFIIDKDNDDLINIRQIDKALKLLGILVSHDTREEILRTKDCVVGGKIAVCFGEEAIFVAPSKETVMDKKFKELCRVAGIPPKIRPYMYEVNIDINALR